VDRSRATLLAMHAVLVLCALIVIAPVAWITVAAFKTQIALLTGQVLFQPTWANFDELLFSRSSDYGANFLNSLAVASVSTAAVAFFSTLAAYSLLRLGWPGWVPSGLLLWSVVFHMLPPITMVGPWYVMFRTIGIDNTYSGLILANIALNLPVGIWLMSVFVRDIPVELEEASRSCCRAWRRCRSSSSSSAGTNSRWR
jgi:multiple sugar transport system permease protein